LKCSLCGERSVYPSAVPFADQKAAWRDLRASGSKSGSRLRRGEALCGVCYAKRVSARDLQWLPSTSEIAATPFKLALLPHAGRVADEIAALRSAVDALGEGRAAVVPALRRALHGSGPAQVLAGLPGEYLLPDPRDTVEGDVDGRLLRAVEVAAKRLRGAAKQCGVAPPRPYLAVLAFDGDEMGKWLSGMHNRSLREYITDRASRSLADDGLESYLDKQWPLTPALHASISDACGAFSQFTAPHVVNGLGLPGFLVYAGGDDVLALTATGIVEGREVATDLALQLRLRYSGHVRRDGAGDIGDEGNAAGFTSPGNGIHLAFGERATASAGIAVFHHRWPMGRALAEAHAALDVDAKDKMGRNALAIRILRRSGQKTFAAMPFGVGVGSDGARSVVRSFNALVGAFGRGALSSRVVSEVHRRLAAFERGMSRDDFGVLVVPLVRQAASNHMPPGLSADARSSVMEAMDDLLARGVVRPASVCDGEAGGTVHPGDLVALIEAASFLAREGDE
jgi:CRISPR-associated protein Cmr2